MEKFRVSIERIERYSHQVVVEASSAREAEKNSPEHGPKQ